MVGTGIVGGVVVMRVRSGLWCAVVRTDAAGLQPRRRGKVRNGQEQAEEPESDHGWHALNTTTIRSPGQWGGDGGPFLARGTGVPYSPACA